MKVNVTLNTFYTAALD